MPVSTNIFAAAVMAPFITVMSAVVLATLQRAIDWVAFIAKTPQKYVALRCIAMIQTKSYQLVMQGNIEADQAIHEASGCFP
jgi:hypothetical protein